MDTACRSANRGRCGTGKYLPGAYQIASAFSPQRLPSKTLMASGAQPMLEPSASNLVSPATRASASSLLTSLYVAQGRAISTLPTCTHGQAPSIYLRLPLLV